MFGKKPNREVQLSKIMGITPTKCDEIIKAFDESRAKTKTWSETLDGVRKSGVVASNNDFMLVGYLFGRSYEQINPTTKTQIRSMIELLSGVKK